MHKRDNLRAFPSHADVEREKQCPRDCREIKWLRNGSGQQVLEIDCRSVAEVRPFGPARFDILGDPVQPHIAKIIGTAGEYEFNSCDAARIFCERTFAA